MGHEDVKVVVVLQVKQEKKVDKVTRELPVLLALWVQPDNQALQGQLDLLDQPVPQVLLDQPVQLVQWVQRELPVLLVRRVQLDNQALQELQGLLDQPAQRVLLVLRVLPVKLVQ
jgi:hypothetical protein